MTETKRACGAKKQGKSGGEGSGVNLRALALDVLLEVEAGRPSHIVLRSVLEKYQYLERRERAFLTRVVEGTLEQRLRLDYIIDQFSSVKVKKQKPVIREILRLSVYQLAFLDSVPPSAVCNEAVKLAKARGFRTLAGFVNGVLRGIARSLDEVAYPPQSQPVEYLSVRYSMPEWIVSDWLPAYGQERTERILQGLQEERPLTIRVNQARITPEALKERLLQQSVRVTPAPYLANALQIADYDYLAALPEFQEGLFTVQDLSSMLAVEAAGAKPGDFCIDVCAAPGGKSLYLAEKVGPDGRVAARDLTEYKAGLIREAAERLGAENLSVSVQDACLRDEASLKKADVLLADLPCSGLGVLRKKPEIRYRMSREQQEELAALQKKILGVVQDYVKPGGILLYSTCTISRGENEELVRWFLEHFPYEAADLTPCLPEALRGGTAREGYLQLLPGIHGCDGFFFAKFVRKKD